MILCRISAVVFLLMAVGSAVAAPARAADMKPCEAARGLVVLGTVMKICKEFRLTPQAYLAASIYKKVPGQRNCQSKMQAEAMLQMNEMPGSTPKEKMALWCEATFTTFKVLSPKLSLLERK